MKRFERYEYKASKIFVSFKFESIGPKGTIKKSVIYQDIGDVRNLQISNVSR